MRSMRGVLPGHNLHLQRMCVQHTRSLSRVAAGIPRSLPPAPSHFATQKRQDNDDNDGDGDGVSCRICGEPTSGALYGCDLCNFYPHRSCAEFQLPATLQHFYHPCLLTLSIDKEESTCSACGDSYDFYSYLCEPCNFRIEISCALYPLIMESRGQQQFHHFIHGHPLKLTEIKHDDEILCYACLNTAQVRHTSAAAANASFSSITHALICLRKYITHSIHTIL
ncbi:hypothetical protein NC653_035481 [Populus alba x Populus x berolinensis]|uniref:DC1 domain-containing protein n=1 Tax=Populus alba x Populus x berolinensis TaxID=444605 RepID=A0AAD6LQ46_9ROSI|nr:hypothetical protein NC653_035481 [Populus alba x Populus x berolinensis]